MANMSYCRFRNTLNDLRDCSYNMGASLDGEEFKARKYMIELMKEMIEEWDGFEFVPGEGDEEN